MAETRPKPHALLIAYPLQGHVIPSVHLATKLAATGFAVTFVNTEAVHHQTSKAHNLKSNNDDDDDNPNDIFTSARKSGLDIRYEIVTDGLPIDFDRSLNHDEFMSSLLHEFAAHVEDLVRRVTTASSPISCIIADTFFVWPATIAKKFGIPYVSFWTEPALVYTLYYHLDLLTSHGHFDNRSHTITYIPGVAAIDPTDLMSYLQATDTTTVEHQIIFKAFKEVKFADFVLCNTVEELEPHTIAALRAEQRFYAVGPIFPAVFGPSTIPTSMWPESRCTDWLESKPQGSVLYISFGSYAHISRKDLDEIAYGVMDSNVSFIWVLRPDIVSSVEPDPLSREFREQTVDRGIIVPWCNQLEVLSHASVGGFLTHCGWNSILESIWRGVPMLCFPLLTDQFTNRKLVVRDWRIGFDLGGKDRANRSEISEKIKCLMGGEGGEMMRKEVKVVRRELENATVNSNGSSQKNFDAFVAELVKHVEKKGNNVC